MIVTVIKSICEGAHPEKKIPRILRALKSFADIGINIKKSSNSMT